jgi:hypothetical protein
MGTGDGIMEGADNLGTEKCAFTSKPVSLSVFLVAEKEVLRVSNANGILNAISSRV